MELINDSNFDLLAFCNRLTNCLGLLIGKLSFTVKTWPNAFSSAYDRAYQRNIHTYIIDERGRHVEY